LGGEASPHPRFTSVPNLTSSQIYPSYSLVIDFEEAFKIWEGKYAQLTHSSEWSQVNMFSMLLRVETKGRSYQATNYSPAWMDLAFRLQGQDSVFGDCLEHPSLGSRLKEFMTVSSNWVGEGKDPLLRHSPDGDIIKVLHRRVNLGLFTIFIKIRAHRGELLNEKADRWAEEGRDDVGNVRWDSPSLHPTFSWMDAGVEHRCTLRARVNLKAVESQLPFHNNFASEFLNQEDNSRDLLRKHWQDNTVPNRSKRRLLQSIGYQFPCAKLLKLWGIRENDDCRLCKRLHPDVAPWPESLGYGLERLSLKKLRFRGFFWRRQPRNFENFTLVAPRREHFRGFLGDIFGCSTPSKKRCFSTQEYRFLSRVSSQHRATHSDVSFQTK